MNEKDDKEDLLNYLCLSVNPPKSTSAAKKEI